MIDTHCHLDLEAFAGRREEVIQDAAAAGVSTIINVGVDRDSCRRSVDLAQRHRMVYASVGVHPHDARMLTEELVIEIKRLAAHNKVVAIGEIGLDFYRDLSPRDVQRRAFRRQLELAVELKLPVIIHMRESIRETIDLVRDLAKDLVGGVFHCFPGDIAEAREVVALGFVISVGGVITFPNAKMARVAAEVPLDSVILETDAPYLAPVPHRGEQNQPAYVKHIYSKFAELRNMTVEEVEHAVDRTAKKLFRLEDTFGG
ncbi:MAG TPA: TatD family hydrolase [Candidatus Deferrimicrobium sp.]|nr:TatD family hydrolase [Candidatus Deferrimicrobium sp.]